VFVAPGTPAKRAPGWCCRQGGGLLDEGLACDLQTGIT
jgi:hypothetical protein